MQPKAGIALLALGMRRATPAWLARITTFNPSSLSNLLLPAPLSSALITHTQAGMVQQPSSAHGRRRLATTAAALAGAAMVLGGCCLSVAQGQKMAPPNRCVWCLIGVRWINR